MNSGQGPYLAVTAGHLGIDVFNSMGSVLAAYLVAPLSLTAAQVGLAVGVYQFLAGATQPGFGWLADRIGSRWMGPLSVAWAVGGVAGAFWVANTSRRFDLFLLIFAVAALGSGAFHPQGTLHSGRAPGRRSESSTAIFFLCGQLGLTAGPAIAGLLLAWVGPPGIYGLALAELPLVIFMFWGLRATSHREHLDHHAQAERSGVPRPFSARAIALLVAIYSLRGWAIIGTASLLPLMFQEAGFGSTGYGVLTGLFWLGGAITGVLAAGWAARFGRRTVMATTTALGALLLIVLPMSTGWVTFFLAVATGACLGAAHSILIVVAQALLPVRQGLAGGLALGYFFGIGALASFAIGALADIWSLAPVIQWGAAPGILAAILIMALPSSGPYRESDDEVVAPDEMEAVDVGL